MKKLLTTAAIAAIAISGISTAASAGSTNRTVYSGIVGSTPVAFDNVGIPTVPGNVWTHIGDAIRDGAAAGTQLLWDAAQNAGGTVKALSGSRYHQEGSVADNTNTAAQTLTNSFTLKGAVSRDCSFYGGGSISHTIDLGTIGVRTGDNDNVSIAFNQNGDAHANVNSATAGCNTNNSVIVTKANGTDGLRNSDTSIGYDSDQFTNHIPYQIDVSFTGVAKGTSGAGGSRTFTVGTNQNTGGLENGAWRSVFNMNITAPAQNLGLIAGDYSDTITVTLKAI